MFPNTAPTTTENPIASWVVSDEIYPKGQLHPSNDPAIRNRLTWGVLLQVVATQLRDYEREHDAKEKEQWQTRIQKTINEVNQLNSFGLWGYQDTPLHSPGYPVQNVPAGCWLENMISVLKATFGNAIPAITLRTDN